MNPITKGLTWISATVSKFQVRDSSGTTFGVFSTDGDIMNKLDIYETGVITGDATLTTEQAECGILILTAGQAAARAIIAPAVAGKYFIVRNLVAATHACTVKVSGQTGVSVAATKTAIVVCNGTDYVRVTADA